MIDENVKRQSPQAKKMAKFWGQNWRDPLRMELAHFRPKKRTFWGAKKVFPSG